MVYQIENKIAVVGPACWRHNKLSLRAAHWQPLHSTGQSSNASCVYVLLFWQVDMLVSVWPSGLRRWLQVPFYLGRRGFEPLSGQTQSFDPSMCKFLQKGVDCQVDHTPLLAAMFCLASARPWSCRESCLELACPLAISSAAWSDSFLASRSDSDSFKFLASSFPSANQGVINCDH